MRTAATRNAGVGRLLGAGPERVRLFRSRRAHHAVPRAVANVDVEIFVNAAASVAAELLNSAAPVLHSLQSADSSLLVAAGGGVVSLAVIGVAALTSGRTARAVEASVAWKQLVSAKNSVLVDIRPKAEIRRTGSPDLSLTEVKSVSFPVTRDEDGKLSSAFIEKLTSQETFTSDSYVIILDSDGQSSFEVGNALLEAGLPAKSVLAVIDGTDGAQGWRASDLPWKKPFAIDLSMLSKLPLPDVTAITDIYRKDPSVFTALLAALGLAGAGVVLVNELELILELAGVIGLGQLVANNFLFAVDRERTLKKLDELVNKDVAINEAGKDMRRLAQAILDIGAKSGSRATQKLPGAAIVATDEAQVAADIETQRAWLESVAREAQDASAKSTEAEYGGAAVVEEERVKEFVSNVV